MSGVTYECPECHKRLTGKEDVCPRCGVRLRRVRCARCGHIGDEWEFSTGDGDWCPKCMRAEKGTAIEADIRARLQDVHKPSQAQKSLRAVRAVLLFVLGAFFVWIVLHL